MAILAQGLGSKVSLLPIFETRPPTPMADAETAKPPEAIPDRYKDAVGKLDPRAQALYITHRWPGPCRLPWRPTRCTR